MNVDAWHFLVSRNRYLDYRTVVAPDFLCKAKIYNLLARVADGDLTGSSKGFFRQITGSKSGDFTIVFRVIKATEKSLNPEGTNEILKDSFGREIYLVEGIFVKGIRSKKIFCITNQHFEEAHKLLMESYKQFWEFSEPHPAIPSPKFSLIMDKSSRFLQLEELPPFQVPSKARNLPIQSKVNLVAFLVTILITLMLAIWLTPIKNLFGQSIVDACTTTQDVKIDVNSQDNIDSIINNQRQKWHKDYPNAEIFLNGSLKLKSESLQKLKNLNKRKEPNKPEQYTIRLNEDNSLQMQDHPLDLGITQLHNQKVVKKTTIVARIIHQKECPN